VDDNFDLAPEQWATLRRLLAQALDLEPAAREPWLQALAPSLAAFLPRLQRLLAHESSGTALALLNTLPKVETADFAPLHADRADEHVGPYRLLRELGSGGMASVWLAERTDMLQGRHVALKLPHGAWRRAGLAERLAREREILATLNHPNIASLYDAGVTAAGQPYLALEYVEGLPLPRFSQTHALDLRHRVALFMQVCTAVAHAHARLVVHRDLKPSNILVDALGQVRLLDFGIAKLLHSDTAQASELTREAGNPFTPDYAAPEQIMGLPLGTAVDIYSLGVVLFELLTGQRPYTLKRPSRAALEEAIMQAEVARPSDTVTDPALKRALRGDLDTIVAKAMHKTPALRYATVNALADDLRRYLAHEPVLARPENRVYRWGKFVRRHRLGVVAGSAVVTALSAGTALALWQAQVASRQETRAREVADFTVSIFREADPYLASGDKTLSALDLLRQANTRLQAKPQLDAGTRVELLTVLGESLVMLQDNAAAKPLLEEGIRLLPQVPARDEPRLRARLHYMLSQAHVYLEDEPAGQRALDVALAATAALAPEDFSLKVEIRLQEAAILLRAGNWTASIERLESLVASLQAMSGEPTRELGKSQQLLAVAYRGANRARDSLQSAGRARELFVKLYPTQPTHPSRIDATMTYGRSLAASGDFAAGLPLVSEAAEGAAQRFGPQSMMAGHFRTSLAGVQLERGLLDAALDNARRGLEIYLLQSKPGTLDHARRLRTLGLILLAHRRSSQAEQTLAEAAAIAGQASDSRGQRGARAAQGLALAHAGALSSAAALLQAVVDGPDKNPEPQRALARRNLGIVHRLQGRHDDAAALLQLALPALAEPPLRGERMVALTQLGLAHLGRGAPDAAAPVLDEAASIAGELLAASTPNAADLWLARGRLWLARGDVNAALPELTRAHGYWQQTDARSRWAREAEQALAQARALAARR
jgi:eukaryotic-like serine/threonine-protein kinase